MELITTICGIATPSGEGGIGIIRISGPDTVNLCNRIFRKHRNLCDENFLTQYWQEKIDSLNLIHGYIVEPSEKFIIDEVLIGLMRSPHSYTKEDVIEIHSHGGPTIVKTILELLVTLGARIAEPGEFTKRAFLNGRIDLAQAEAVIDLIQAKNSQALKLASASLSGELSDEINDVRKKLLHIISEIQAMLEFPDEVADIFDRDLWINVIEGIVVNQLEPLIDNFQAAKITKDGFKVGIIGQPNVGKSSLLNVLLRKERAIVTDIPGTTRDIIEDHMSIEGIDLFLYDTAGIRKSQDVIEQIGVAKSLNIKEECDLILFIVDSLHPFNQEDLVILKELADSPLIYLVNKIDLIEHQKVEALKSRFHYKPIVYISTISHVGIVDVKREIVDFARKNFDSINTSIVPNLRQSELLKKSCEVLCGVNNDFRNEMPEDLIVIGLEEAVELLGKVIGINVEPDILDHIFENFCIGK